MSRTGWEADKMLDIYIHDYLVKRKLYASAKTFKAEGKVTNDPVAIDAPGGFLFEWWSVFWDIFIARTNDKQSDAASSYIETQLVKAQEMQGQQSQKPQQHGQQLLLQRHAQEQQQQHQRDVSQHSNRAANRLVGNIPLARKNSATSSALATKIYEERLKLPLQRDSSEDGTMQQRISDHVGQFIDPTHASMSKSSQLGGQSPRKILLGAAGGVSGNVQTRNQQLHVSSKDINNEMNSMMSPRAAGPLGSLIGVPGSNHGGSNLTLKGWPLAGLDQLRSLHQHKPLMQSSQPYNQLQLQQQILLQAQQNLTSPSANDLDYRQLRMFLSNRNMNFGKDVHINSASDAVPNFGSPMQVPVLPSEATDIIFKLQQQQVENNNLQEQQYLQHSLSGRSQNLNHDVQQQDKMISSGSVTVDSMSNAFQGNEQTSKSQIGRKRKQPVSSSGPANSLGTANTTGPSPSSPLTPSTHTPGDVILPHMFGSDGVGSLTLASNQLADMDHLVSVGALEDNVESFLSHNDAENTDGVGSFTDVSKGITFTEIQLIPASTSKVESCHFSSDGKLLATGGHDKNAVLWCTESFTVKSTLEEHSQWITDVRFSPGISSIATSSADKTVRIWDADRPGYSLRTFTGHSTTVMSVDFHPSKEDLICSCDNNSEIRYWSIKNGSCAGVFKGGASQLRFQPRIGRFLAAAAGNFIRVLDVETQVCRHKLQGHKNHIHSVCWDSSGDYLASVSDDMVRVWTAGSGSKGECIHELSCSGNKFHTSAFHPSYPSLLIIGCHETMELWNFAENKTMTIHAHDKLISSLAVSSVSGLIASASHDKCVKLWK